VEDTTLRPSSVFLVAAIAAAMCFGSVGHGQETQEGADPSALLEQGIELFQNYEFGEAVRVLRAAKARDDELNELSDDQKQQLTRYLDEAAKAKTPNLEGLESLELAERLMASPTVGETELEQAVSFYRKALEVEPYLPPAAVQRAREGLAKATKELAALEPETEEVQEQPVAAPTTQPQGSAEGEEAPEPAELQEVPSESVRLEPVAPRLAPPGSEPTLMDRVIEARQIQKQQALASFAAADQRIREAVDAREFLTARDILSEARQEVYRNRNLFTQSEFERLLLNVDSLAALIEAEQQAYQQRQIMQQMQEAETQRLERERRTQEEKYERIQEIYLEVARLRREKRFDEAIERAREILAIEPTYDRAKWVIEDLQDLSMYREQNRIDEEVDAEGRVLFNEGDKARIPYSDEVRYPENWEELTQSRRELMRRLNKTLVGEAPARLTERKLEGTIVEDVRPLRGSLRNAFNYFKGQGIKLFVRWDALEIEGLVPDSEVNFESLEGLEGVSLKSALELLLKTLSPEVNYGINTDGFVVVSTRDALRDENLTPRMGRLETRVYNISDIMEYSPSFSSIPEVEPQQEEEAINLEDIEATEFEDLESLEDMVDLLEELIISLVRPDSWRIAGGEGTIDVWRKRWLIIYQTPEVHDEIDEMLEGLRETQTIQIAMEARFITVSRNFLENIGIDLDVIFNQSQAGYDFTGAENTWGNMVQQGFGSSLVMPRTFSRLAVLPVSPAGVPGQLPVGFVQPYQHHGLIPTGNGGSFTAGNMTPIPMLQGSRNLVIPENTGLPGNLAGTAGSAFQVMGAFLDDLQVNFLLEATQMDRYSSIVQAPRVIMQNGSLGYIAVQTDVPYVEEVEVALGESSGGTEPQVETMGFGTVLAVRASTRDLRYVNLYMVPQVTARAPDADLVYETTVVSQGAVSILSYLYPGRRTTRVETTVSVPDGGTLLLGGLKQAGEIEREAGVPVLSKLPVVRRFFSNKSITKDNFTLLVLIKPKILIREELEPGYLTDM